MSTSRNITGVVKFELKAFLGRSWPIKFKSVVFPHDLVGLLIRSSGEIVKASKH